MQKNIQKLLWKLPQYFVDTFSLRTLYNDGHIVTCDEIGLVTGHGVRVSRELRDCDSAQ